MRRLIASLALILFAGLACAQTQFPARAITIVSPFPPGGSTDAVARIMAQRMGTALGRSVIVENAGGAGGSIGVGRVARAAPDGYTIDIGQWDTHVANGVVYALNYDLQKDFEPIGLLSINPQLLLARKNFPADDLKGLVAWMKANPGKATFANQHAAAQTAGVLLQQLTGTTFLFVPYRGGGPALQDLLAGHIDLVMIQAAAAMPQVRAGTIKALAILAPSRSPVVPGIPSADEAGVPGLYLPGWFAFFARRRTSSPGSTARWSRRSRTPGCAPASPSSGSMSPHASSRRRRGSPPSTRPRSRNGGPMIKAAGIKAE